MASSKNKIGTGLRTWVEIDRNALKSNFRALKRLIGEKTLLMGVVKSNAYGHGLVPVAEALESFGIDWLGVDSVMEAFRLRKEGLRVPILVLGYTLPEHFGTASKEKISLTISSFSTLEKAFKWTARNKKQLRVHLKLDTGMHRQGFLPDDIPALKKNLQENYSNILQNIRIMKMEGVYSHLANANPKKPGSSNKQIRIFKACVNEMREVLLPKPLTHIAASSGLLMFPRSFDMARSGIMLYGLWPSPEARAYGEKKLTLTPVLSWRTLIGEVKHIPRGEKIGYDFTETLARASTVAICPIGYWHGYPCSLSGKGELVVRGTRAKVLGRVSMNMIAIDVTDIPGAAIGDVATIIGKDGKEQITAEELAARAGTLHYEIVTRINPLIQRIER